MKSWPRLEDIAPSLPEHVRGRLSVDDRGCWVWNGPVNGKSPSIILSEGGRKRRVSVRRIVFEAAGGQVAEHANVRNGCSNSRCVYPGHVAWVVDGLTPRYDSLVEAWLARDAKNAVSVEVSRQVGVSRQRLRQILQELVRHPDRMSTLQRDGFMRSVRWLSG